MQQDPLSLTSPPPGKALSVLGCGEAPGEKVSQIGEGTRIDRVTKHPVLTDDMANCCKNLEARKHLVRDTRNF